MGADVDVSSMPAAMSPPAQAVPPKPPPGSMLAKLAALAGGAASPVEQSTYGVEKRWTPLLAKRFCPVSSAFLEHYHELRGVPGGRGLNSTEAMLIVQLMDFKWTEKAPFPTVKRLATRMSLSPRMIRTALKSLEDNGFIRRDPMPDGGPNRYYFDGLFKALEDLVRRKAEEAA
jgi:DNA-binding transcriptional ArsR family regulator